MNVLWLAPFPIDRVHHPSPWIESLADMLVECKAISNLTLLSFSTEIKLPIKVVQHNNYKVIFLKVPSLKRDILFFYIERIIIMRSWLKMYYKNYDLIHIHGTEQQYHVAAAGIDIPQIISIQGLIYKYVKFIPEIFSVRRLEWSLKSLYEKLYLKKFNNFSCRTTWDTKAILDINSHANIYMNWEMIRKQFFIQRRTDFFKNRNLLFMGGSSDIKGVKEAFIAFNVLLNEFDLRLLILGRGNRVDYEKILQNEKLTNIDIEKNVEILGLCSVEEIVAAMMGSFCLLHPSYIDNSPNSICEAQILGLPVIATNVGGVSSLVQNENTGLLIDKDPLSIATNVKRLLGDELLFNKLSDNARQIARKRHNPDMIVQSFINCYNSVQVSSF